MPQGSPRGTYLKVAEALRQQIRSGEITERVPSKADLMRIYGVGESTVERALDALKADGTVESARGAGVFVAGTGDRRPMVEQVTEILRTKRLKVGDPFPTEGELCELTHGTRGPVRTAIAQLEGQGIVGRGANGRRVVLALPSSGK